MAAGGINLRKWHSNSLELLEKVNSSSMNSSSNPCNLDMNKPNERSYVKTTYDGT